MFKISEQRSLIGAGTVKYREVPRLQADFSTILRAYRDAPARYWNDEIVLAADASRFVGPSHLHFVGLHRRNLQVAKRLDFETSAKFLLTRR
jgi:hypothetical protein